MQTSDMKGNRYGAFAILMASLVIGILMVKPILLCLAWIIGWLIHGVLALIIAGLLIVAGYWLYRIEAWAFKTLFTNEQPDFPDLTIEGLSTPEPDDDDDDEEPLGVA